MVISGNKRVRRDIDTVKSQEDMDGFKPPLHNFDLPLLKWGNQKHLRCMNIVDDFSVNVSPSFVRRNQSSEISGGGSAIRIRRNESSDYNNRFPPSSEKLKSRIGVSAGDSGEMEATREKVMLDFKKEVHQMKVDILRIQPPVTTANDSPAERPWNLRTRRAAFKPPSEGVKVNGYGEFSKPNCLSSRDDVIKSRERRIKFSVSLSRDELEDDFMVMTGRRLPRKPKKRPRVIQKQLDTLFPGLWLSEVTADMYEVPDEAGARKR